jgi:hypothetical protein
LSVGTSADAPLSSNGKYFMDKNKFNNI